MDKLIDEFIEQGARILQDLREGPVPVSITEGEREELLAALGTTQSNVDTLLSIPTRGGK